MIKLYYAYPNILTKDLIDELKNILPANLRLKLERLKKDPDKLVMLTSLALLRKVLDENGHSIFTFDQLNYSLTGRPYFPGAGFDFNISHTETCAAVVFSNDCRIGLDIEKIKKTDLMDFEDYFSAAEWDDICSSTDQTEKFYYYWTLFESGVKADGGGLTLISEKKVRLDEGRLYINNIEWFYNHYSFDKTISCCIASNKKNSCLLNEVTAI